MRVPGGDCCRIQARATPEAFLYVSATRGFKSGGFNPSRIEGGRSYGPEFAWTFEGSVKNTIAVASGLCIFMARMILLV